MSKMLLNLGFEVTPKKYEVQFFSYSTISLKIKFINTFDWDHVTIWFHNIDCSIDN
jgi:hypothetical protein